MDNRDKDMERKRNRPGPAWRRRGLMMLLVGIVLGAVGWGAFSSVLLGEGTNREAFCISCHELRETVYEEFLASSHNTNRTGVRATCPDCHVPKPLLPKLTRKLQAANDLYQHWMGSIDTEEKFEARRPELAKRVWQRMKNNDSRECRSCHEMDAMDYVRQGERGMRRHTEGLGSGQTCIDCHKGIVHKLPHGMAADAGAGMGP